MRYTIRLEIDIDADPVAIQSHILAITQGIRADGTPAQIEDKLLAVAEPASALNDHVIGAALGAVREIPGAEPIRIHIDTHGHDDVPDEINDLDALQRRVYYATRRLLKDYDDPEKPMVLNAASIANVELLPLEVVHAVLERLGDYFVVDGDGDYRTVRLPGS